MFHLQQNGPSSRDCTAPYKVILDKEYTVKEFISDVLSINPREWGYIGIKKRGHIFGSPYCEYRYGNLKYNLPEEIQDKKILSVESSGGWSRMDYLITL